MSRISPSRPSPSSTATSQSLATKDHCSTILHGSRRRGQPKQRSYPPAPHHRTAPHLLVLAIAPTVCEHQSSVQEVAHRTPYKVTCRTVGSHARRHAIHLPFKSRSLFRLARGTSSSSSSSIRFEYEYVPCGRNSFCAKLFSRPAELLRSHFFVVVQMCVLAESYEVSPFIIKK